MNIAGNGSSTFTPGEPPFDNGFIKPGALAKDSENNVYFSVADGFSGSAQGDIYKLSADYSTLEVIVPDVYSVNGIAFDQNDNLYFSKGGSVATDGYTLEYIYVLLAGETTPIEFAGNSFHGIPSYQWNAG